MRIAALALLLAPAPAAGQVLDVVGPRGQHAQMTADNLAFFPRERVSVTEGGRVRVFEGPSVNILAGAVGAPQGIGLSGRELATVLRFSGPDGRQVVLTLAEADPRFRKGRVIVAFREGAGPLAPGEGPFRLVVEDDLDPTRSGPIDMIEVLRLAEGGD